MTTLTSPAAARDAEAELSRRLTVSARTLDSPLMPNTAFAAWLAHKRRVNRFEVRRIPFSAMSGWHFTDGTGNLVHDSGRFFAVEGLAVRTDLVPAGGWMQPIINQPEIGVLGILVKEFDGVLHCLMQAKMEPGNINTVQLSPTVQATRSNYSGVHRGRGITHLDYFATPRRGRVLFDSLQSEQGAWFLRKRNRNIIVETREDVAPHEDFCWLTLGQIFQLLRLDNVVNMDARTVLSCLRPAAPVDERPADAYQAGIWSSLTPESPSLHPTENVLSWLTEIKTRHELVQNSIPLHAVEGWHRHEDEIAHEDDKYFKVIAADVVATNREVMRWCQPLLAPLNQGLVAFLTRRFGGVAHLLVHARAEAGVRDVAELAPTVQCTPQNYRDVPPEGQPLFLDTVLAADPRRVRYRAVQSEEGGRFHHADNLYQIIDMDEDFDPKLPEEYRWVSVHQILQLLRHSNYLNVQARSLVAGLHCTW